MTDRTEEEADFLGSMLPELDAVHGLARRLCAGRADAEDAVQETYLRAWAAWRAGTRPRSARAWLSTLCLNVVRDRARGRSRRPEMLVGDLGEGDATGDDVAGLALDRVEVARVQSALAELDEAQRVAVVLSDVCGLTAREVAAVTASPLGTVLSRIHRGRRAVPADRRHGIAHRRSWWPPRPCSWWSRRGWGSAGC